VIRLGRQLAMLHRWASTSRGMKRRVGGIDSPIDFDEVRDSDIAVALAKRLRDRAA
jgi:hypothetical protein